MAESVPPEVRIDAELDHFAAGRISLRIGMGWPQ